METMLGPPFSKRRKLEKVAGGSEKDGSLRNSDLTLESPPAVPVEHGTASDVGDQELAASGNPLGCPRDVNYFDDMAEDISGKKPIEKDTAVLSFCRHPVTCRTRDPPKLPLHPDTPVVVIIDGMEDFGALAPATFDPHAKVTPENVSLCLLRLIGEAFQTACVKNPQLRVAFVVRHSHQSPHFQLGVPLESIPQLDLPTIPQFVTTLRRAFGRCDGVDLPAVAKRVVGPPEVLIQLLTRLNPKRRKMLSREDIEEAVEGVVVSHRNELLRAFNLWNSHGRPLRIALRELWEQIKGSVHVTDTGAMYATLPNRPPAAWHVVEQSCFLRSQTSKPGGRSVIPLYPILVEVLEMLKCFRAGPTKDSCRKSTS